MSTAYKARKKLIKKLQKTFGKYGWREGYFFKKKRELSSVSGVQAESKVTDDKDTHNGIPI